MKLTIAFNTFREAIRQRFILLVALIALILVATSRYFLRLDLGHEQLKFIFDFTSGALNFFGVIIAVVASCNLFASEIDNKTIITLMSKPISFFDFVFGKLMGIFMALGVFATFIFAVSLATLGSVDASIPSDNEFVDSNINYVGLFCYCFIQWLKLCMCASISALMCSLSKSFLFSTAVSFMCVLIFTMADTVISLGGRDSDTVKVVSFLLPDLQLLSRAEAFVFGALNASTFVLLAIYALIYIFCCSILASCFFSKRDF